jgi:hypothetical protein
MKFDLSGASMRDVRVIQTLGLNEVRTVWRKRYGEPPKLRSVDLVRRMLAWKIEIEAAGGLDPELRKALRIGQPSPAAPKVARGAKLAREWKGVRHDVEITEAGVLYQGKVFASLSAVARHITGVRWNGPRFFGLRVRSEV